MATGVSTVASISGEYMDHLYEDALFIARSNNVMSQLVRTFTDQTGDQDRSQSEYPQARAESVGETEDYAAPTEFDKTRLATLTPGEIIAQSVLTDRRTETDPQNAREDCSRELGNAIADKVEEDLLATFSSLTGGTIGAAGSVLTWGHLLAARSRLAGSKVPGPYAAVLHEYQWFPLAKSASVAGAQTNASAGLLDEVNRGFYVSTVLDMDIFVSANIDIDGSDDAVGGVFNREALAFDSRRAPRLEPERDASARAWELNITAKYAAGVWRPAFGVQVKSDATAPTS